MFLDDAPLSKQSKLKMLEMLLIHVRVHVVQRERDFHSTSMWRSKYIYIFVSALLCKYVVTACSPTGLPADRSHVPARRGVSPLVPGRVARSARTVSNGY